MTPRAIWYHLYNLKKLKNTNGGVLLLVKYFLKIVQMVPNCPKRRIYKALKMLLEHNWKLKNDKLPTKYKQTKLSIKYEQTKYIQAKEITLKLQT